MYTDPTLAQAEQHMRDLREVAERHRLVMLARCCSAVENLISNVRCRLDRRQAQQRS